jgi:hypothetical protein
MNKVKVFSSTEINDKFQNNSTCNNQTSNFNESSSNYKNNQSLKKNVQRVINFSNSDLLKIVSDKSIKEVSSFLKEI